MCLLLSHFSLRRVFIKIVASRLERREVWYAHNQTQKSTVGGLCRFRVTPLYLTYMLPIPGRWALHRIGFIKILWGTMRYHPPVPTAPTRWRKAGKRELWDSPRAFSVTNTERFLIWRDYDLLFGFSILLLLFYPFPLWAPWWLFKLDAD